MPFHTSANEPLRLLAGAAACGKLPGQGRLLRSLENRTQAKAFPVAVDTTDIEKELRKRREGMVLRDLAYTVFLPLFFVGIGALGAWVLFYVSLRRAKYKIAPQFTPEAFAEREAPEERTEDQNVVVFMGRKPLDNFGFSFGSWTLSVDTSRKKPDEDGEQPQGTSPSVSIQALEDEIAEGLKRAGGARETFRTIYLAQGKVLPDVILPDRRRAPLPHVDAEALEAAAGHPSTRIRRYLMVEKPMVGQEMTIFYFIRLNHDGDDLSLEIQGLVMPPVSEAYRWVDRVEASSFSGVIWDLIYSLFGGLVMLVVGPIRLFLLVSEALSGFFSDPSAKAARRAARDPGHDYGAPVSLRREAANLAATSFFLTMDRRMTEIAFTGRITRTFIDHLDALGIDTSELREQRTTVLNQGIIVKGGEIKAENIQAGLGAQISKITGVGKKG